MDMIGDMIGVVGVADLPARIDAGRGPSLLVPLQLATSQ